MGLRRDLAAPAPREASADPVGDDARSRYDPRVRLNPTPPDRLCDAQGRPTFLWDNDLTLDEVRARLRSPDPDVAAYWLGTVMRQARPDDALTLAPPARMRELWPRLERYLGRERAFWAWYLSVVGE